MTYLIKFPGNFLVAGSIAWIGFAALLSGCAQQPPDPCQEMMQEVNDIHGLEKQLTKTDASIKKFTAAKDTADLNEALRIQTDLRERHKSARIAAANMAASCLPPQLGEPESDQQEQPLDPNQDEQDHKNGK